jgi:hypothetical protein
MTEIKESELKVAIASKLRPERFPDVSGKMFACLGALLNQKWTKPRIASVISTSDGMLLGRAEGDIGFNEVIGDYSDFQRNLWGMVDAAGDLSDEERAFVVILLTRVESGQETSSGETASQLSIDAITRSSN